MATTLEDFDKLKQDLEAAVLGWRTIITQHNSANIQLKIPEVDKQSDVIDKNLERLDSTDLVNLRGAYSRGKIEVIRIVNAMGQIDIAVVM